MPRTILILIVAFVSTTILSTTVFATSTLDERIEISGDTAKELFNAMKPDGTPGRATRGGVPGKALLGRKLVCINYGTIAAGDYSCSIAKNLTPVEIHHIYQHLDVKQITTNAFQRNVKIVGGIIFMSSHNDDQETLNTAMPTAANNKIFYKHPCAKIDTLAKAKKCMNFWVKKIFEPAASENPTHVVVSDESTQRMLSEVMSVNGATRQAIGHAIDAARNSQYLAYVGTFNREFAITYFALDANNTLRPTQVFTLKTANTPNLHREYLERIFGEQGMTWDEILKGYTCAVLLGGKATNHNGFRDYTDDIADRFHGR